jgi:L-alanine-DL-glutamate epimerase-like enolase superfamily enzyme
MPSKLARHELHPLHLPYPRPIRWAGHVESGMDLLLLVLETDDGLRGVGETPIRLRWHAATLKSLTVVLEEVFLPLLQGVDLLDAQAVEAVLGTFREHPLAKSLIDTACWDLRARAAGVPLWKQLGAAHGKVPVSWTLTRAAPHEMSREAEQMREKNGFATFKVKTGQGFDTDRQVLHEIRRAVGDRVALCADSNGAHQVADVPELSRLLADYGVTYFEDPCPFIANREFRALQDSSALPILVDNGCRSVSEAVLFLDAGAQALSVKVMKMAITDSLAVARLAEKRNAKVAVGISATSSLGAIAALSLSASLPDQVKCLPCEETFFGGVTDILVEPLTIVDGQVILPDVPGHDTLIDWGKTATLHAA